MSGREPTGRVVFDVRSTVSLTSAAAARAVPEAQAMPGPRAPAAGVPGRVVRLPAVVEAQGQVGLGLPWAPVVAAEAGGSRSGSRPSSTRL